MLQQITGFRDSFELQKGRMTSRIKKGWQNNKVNVN